MKSLLFSSALIALLFVIYSCNSGNYDADPNTNDPGLTDPDTTPLCPFTLVDTNVCSCIDSMSWFENGILTVSPNKMRAAMNTQGNAIVGIQDSTQNKTYNSIFISIINYSGPGTYTSTNLYRIDDGAKYCRIVWDPYWSNGANLHIDGSECRQARVIVTSDANGMIRGTFFAETTNDTGAVFRINGGQFIAEWQQ